MHSKEACTHGFEGASGVAGVASAVTLSLAFALLALGIEQFCVVFVVGFGVVLPVSTRYGRKRDDRTTDSSADTGPARLRQRYVNGELGDEEFEYRVEQLLLADEDARDASGAKE